MLTAVVAVRLYRDAGVDVFAGGLLFEYACSRQDIDGLSAHLRAVGIPLPRPRTGGAHRAMASPRRDAAALRTPGTIALTRPDGRLTRGRETR